MKHLTSNIVVIVLVAIVAIFAIVVIAVVFFGVMFGDMGHGSIILAFALFLVIFADKLR